MNQALFFQLQQLQQCPPEVRVLTPENRGILGVNGNTGTTKELRKASESAAFRAA
jgi:hypothetical protein